MAADQVRLTDSRRLTGPNLLLDGAGVVIEVAFPTEARAVVDDWRAAVVDLHERLGLDRPTVASRRHAGGATLAFTGPIDRLYALCDVNEAAWAAACSRTGPAGPMAVSDDEVTRLAGELAAEAAPRWLELVEAAHAHDVALLWDDDEFSIGLGRGATTWPVDRLPRPVEVDWVAATDVPVAIVTGTNGKSTTVRLLHRMLQDAGRTAGLTSTDGILVGDQVVERGDFSGPGGARTLLRHPGVEVAILEVARGGLLRRGLPIDRARVATVTNVSDDHLGEYGIDSVDDLAEAKLVVAKAVAHDGGVLVLNADDPVLVAHAPTGQRIRWYSLDDANPTLAASVAAGEPGWTVVGGDLAELTVDESGNRGATPIVPIADVPLTVGGAARHNVANALGAIGVARALGLPPGAVATGLRNFRGDDTDNPGRANRFDIRGVRIVVDFAHNPAGMRAILQTAEAIPADRRLVLLGQAGDRSDDAIDALARTAWGIRPDHVVAIELPNYLRGREAMEVPNRIRDAMLTAGARPDQVEVAPDPIAGVQAALDWARAGDLLLLMVLDRRAEALALLRDLAGGA